MDASDSHLPPGDPQLVNNIVNHLKSQGIFDQFRHDCLADVDTKPSYQNLRQRVDGFVTKVLSNETWSPDLNKNQLRNNIRKQIDESGMLAIGVEHVVEQVVNAKIYQVLLPKIEGLVKQYLGLQATGEGNPTNSMNNRNDISNLDMKIELSVGGNSKKDHRVIDSVVGKASDALVTTDDSNLLTSNSKNKIQREAPSTISTPSKPDTNLNKSDALKFFGENPTARENREPDTKPFAFLHGNESKVVSSSDTNESKSAEVRTDLKPQDANLIVDGKNILENDVITKLDKSWIKQREKARLKYEEPKSKANENIPISYKHTSLSSKSHSSVSESGKTFSDQSKTKHIGSVKGKSSESPKLKVVIEDFEKIQSKAKSSIPPKHHSHKIKVEFQEDNKLEGKNKESKIHRVKNDPEQSKMSSKQDFKSKGSKVTSDEKSSSSSDAFNKYDVPSKQQHSGKSSSSTPRKESKDEKLRHGRRESRSAFIDTNKGRDSFKLQHDSVVNSEKKSKIPVNMPNTVGQSSERSKSASTATGKTDIKDLSLNKHSGKNLDKNSHKKSKLNESHSRSRSKTDLKLGLKDYEKSVETSEILKMPKALNDTTTKESFSEGSFEKRSQKDNEASSKMSSVKPRKDLCNDGKRCHTPPLTNLPRKVEMKSRKKQNDSNTVDNTDMVIETSNAADPKMNDVRFSCSSSSNGSPQENFSQKIEPGKNEKLDSRNVKTGDENEEDKSDSDWSNVTISSVHTSDLSSFDDRISLSSDEEMEQKSKRLKKSKKKVPLKEVKQIAQDFDGKVKEETDMQEKQENVVCTSKARKEDTAPKVSPTLDVVHEEKYSSSEDDIEMQSFSSLFKSSRKVRRKRKLNPKYASSDYTSIFTSSRKQELRDSPVVSDSSDHCLDSTENINDDQLKMKRTSISHVADKTNISTQKSNSNTVEKSDTVSRKIVDKQNVCDGQLKVNKDDISVVDNRILVKDDVSHSIKPSAKYYPAEKMTSSVEKSNDASIEKGDPESPKVVEKHQYTIHGCEYFSSDDFPSGTFEELSDEDSESGAENLSESEDSKSSHSSDEEGEYSLKNISDSFRKFEEEFKPKRKVIQRSASSDSITGSNEMENQHMPYESEMSDTEHHEKSVLDVRTTANKSGRGELKNQIKSNFSNVKCVGNKVKSSSKANNSTSKTETSSIENYVRTRGRTRKRPSEACREDQQLYVPEKRTRTQIDAPEGNVSSVSTRNDFKKNIRQSTASSDSWDLTNRPKRRLSELSQSDTHFKNDSSKFYDSSDLYKPRPVISSSKRRSRVQSPS